jgi:hypothetical protein
MKITAIQFKGYLEHLGLEPGQVHVTQRGIYANVKGLVNSGDFTISSFNTVFLADYDVDNRRITKGYVFGTVESCFLCCKSFVVSSGEEPDVTRDEVKGDYEAVCKECAENEKEEFYKEYMLDSLNTALKPDNQE